MTIGELIEIADALRRTDAPREVKVVAVNLDDLATVFDLVIHHEGWLLRMPDRDAVYFGLREVAPLMKGQG